MKNLCVFCGSRFGVNPRFKVDAEKLGQLMAQAGIDLVYGGGNVGLMGAVADAVMLGGGQVTGVIPKGLFDREVAHHKLTSLEITEDMHSRKARMSTMADAFVALPGGYGTLDELCEIITWAQLGLHKKPIFLLEIDGFWAGFLQFVDHCIRQGFITEQGLFTVVHSPEELIKRLREVTAP